MKTQENLHDQIQRSGSQKRKLPLLLALAIIIAASSAQATIIVNAQQVGGNVVLTYSGSVDLNSLVSPNDLNHLTSGTTGLVVAPTNFGISFEPMGVYFDLYNGVLSGTYPTFLTTVTTFANSVSGNYFYFDGDNTIPATPTLRLGVPTGYTTGGSISGSMTFNSETFASLGLTPGTDEFSWSSGSNSDNLILNVPNNVPDTGSTLILLALSFGGILVGARRWKPATA